MPSRSIHVATSGCPGGPPLGKIATELRLFLSTNGYYYAQVPSPKIIFAADELRAKVVYKIQLNQRYYVEVKNVKHYTHDYLEEEILKLNTFYSKDGNLGSEMAEKLRSFYINEFGVIRAADHHGGPANENDPPI